MLADMLSCWMRRYRCHSKAIRRISIQKHSDAVPKFGKADEKDWPTRENILNAQKSTAKEVLKNSVKDSEGFVRVNDEIWLSQDRGNLKLRYLKLFMQVLLDIEGRILQKAPSVNTSTGNVSVRILESFGTYVFLYAIKVRKSNSKPISNTLHADKTNEVLHFDCLFLRNSKTGETYVLVINDDLSAYCLLCPTSSRNAEHASAMLPLWVRTFFAPKFGFRIKEVTL